MHSITKLLLRGSRHRDWRTYITQTEASKSNPFLRFSNTKLSSADHGILLNTLLETKATVLPNGLQVTSQKIPYLQTASLGMWINSGSRFEFQENNGTAHFLEHILFKGTKRRNSKQLEIEIENMGGQLNAYTGREQTCYYVKLLAGDLKGAMDILSDIILYSNLSEQAIEHERNVIIREYEEVNKQVNEVVFDRLHLNAFSQCSLGRTILGPVENIKTITRNHLTDYIQTHYKGPRMVLGAAGAVDHDELVDLALKAFGSIPGESAETSVKALIAKDPSIFTGVGPDPPEKPEAPEAYYALAFQGPSWTDAESICFMLWQVMLGQYDKAITTPSQCASRPLMAKFAETGAADGFMTFNTNYHDTGLFGIYVVTDKERCAASAEVVANEFRNMCITVDEVELARARNQLKAAMMFYQDNTYQVAENIARELLVYNRRISRAEWFARIDAVDVDFMNAAIKRYMCNRPVAMSAAGNSLGLPGRKYFEDAMAV